MSYLGQVELKSSEIRRIDVTGSTSATHTLTWTPASEQSLIITINGIKQQNNYSISGVTLTLDDALLSADKMEVIGILDIGEATIPPDDSITTAMVKDDAIDADKLANSINTEIAANTAKVTNATHTGDVTGATALTIAVDAVDIAMLSATGTASATTFLRGDNAWSTIETGTSWQAVQTTGFTAVAGKGYPCNTTGGAFIATLPASASVGDTIEFVDYAGTFDTNALTLDPQSLNLKGASSTAFLSDERVGVRLVYADATQGWVTVTGVNETLQAAKRVFSATGGTEVESGGYKYHTFTASGNFVVSGEAGTVEYMMVGGGAGAGTGGTTLCPGGGGAGGLISDSTSVSPGTHAVVIGGGGAIDTNGVDSTWFSLTASGGGAGGAFTGEAGSSGGSGGGGGAASASGGSGTAGQGSAGGNADARTGGGGGGKSAVGATASSSIGAAGGAGTNTYSAWATATSTGDGGYYAGGGGSGTPVGATAGGAGGAGGGGDGGDQSSTRDGAAGTVNTGGGGGGSADNSGVLSGAGGSGIVILRYSV